MLNAAFAQFRNMDQTFQILINAGKCAKLCQTGDITFHQLSFFVVFNVLGPRVGQQAADGKANAFALAVNADDLDINFLTDFEHFAGMIDPFPGNLGKVNQAIGTVDVYKSTKLGQAGHAPFALIALIDLFEQAFFECLARFLRSGFLREDQSAALPVDLDHPHNHRLTNHGAPTLFGGISLVSHPASQADL